MDNSEKFRLLQNIKSPSDLKKIDDNDIDELCFEIRQKIIIAGGYAKYPIIIPITTSTIVIRKM